jgi:hypothetical protein
MGRGICKCELGACIMTETIFCLGKDLGLVFEDLNMLSFLCSYHISKQVKKSLIW